MFISLDTASVKRNRLQEGMKTTTLDLGFHKFVGRSLMDIDMASGALCFPIKVY